MSEKFYFTLNFTWNGHKPAKILFFKKMVLQCQHVCDYNDKTAKKQNKIWICQNETTETNESLNDSGICQRQLSG